MPDFKGMNVHFETLQLHAGQESPDPATDARAVPIYQTTSYVFPSCANAADRFALRSDGNIYGRLTNPTQDVFERRVAALEGGSGALAVASGAAAIWYVFVALAQKGGHIVSSKTVYGGTFNLLAHTLPDSGVTATFVDIADLAAIAHRHGIPLVVDSTFATPYLLRPIEYGADVVIHSATKFIGGHGTSLGGVIVDGGKFDWAASGRFPVLSEPNPSYHGVCFAEAAGAAALVTYIRAVLLRDTGGAISPFNAFLLLQGLETLSLRVERHVQNALRVVEFLKNHPKVAHVNHPSLPENGCRALYDKYFPNGGGSIFTFEIRGGAAEAQAFIDKLRIFSLLANVADVKSLAIHPASTTHGQMTAEELAGSGIRPNTIRLSIGTEHIDDILADLAAALED